MSLHEPPVNNFVLCVLENHRNGGIIGLGHSPNPVFFTYSEDLNMARREKQ